MSTAPPIETRKPTGLPSWPLGLIAGVEGSGKSWKLAEASASSHIHRTFWVGVGEDDPDEYGVVTGARFEIVEHDGTYRGILDAVQRASAQDPGGTKTKPKPNLVVLDSGSRLWQLIVADVQATADARWRRKNSNRSLPDEGAQITMDLWNAAKDRWGHIMAALRANSGPSLLTSRLEQVTLVENGEPTKSKIWKIQTEKNAPYDVKWTVHLRGSYPAHDDHLVTVKSARYEHPDEPEQLPADWNVEGIWRMLGLLDGKVGERIHSEAKSVDEEGLPDVRANLLEQIKQAVDQLGGSLPEIADDWMRSHNGQRIVDTTDIGGLELLRDDWVGKVRQRDADALAEAEALEAANQ